MQVELSSEAAQREIPCWDCAEKPVKWMIRFLLAPPGPDGLQPDIHLCEDCMHELGRKAADAEWSDAEQEAKTVIAPDPPYDPREGF